MLRYALIDDDPSVRTLIRTVAGLTECFELVGEAGDGRAALALLRAASADVAVIDMEMPGMRGDELARRIAEEQLGCRVVLHTGRELEALPAGVFAYVVKSGDLETLFDTMRSAAAERAKAIRAGPYRADARAGAFAGTLTVIAAGRRSGGRP